MIIGRKEIFRRLERGEIFDQNYMLKPYRKLVKLTSNSDEEFELNISGGPSIAGYDIHCAEPIMILPGATVLCSSVERFKMPDDLVATPRDKSSWARMGIQVQNTVIEPGWHGYLTMELTFSSGIVSMGSDGVPQGARSLKVGSMIPANTPIAQVMFELLDEGGESYDGKYQGQAQGPQEAI